LFDQENSSSLNFYLCEKMISVGEFLLAHDVAKAGLKKHKNDRKLCQRAAHALSKAGSPKMASNALGGVCCREETVELKLIVYLPVPTRIYGNRQPIRIPKEIC
jgi:hypothetical protein